MFENRTILLQNTDKWGAIYSADWQTLIGIDRKRFNCEHYRIRDGVMRIAANAFLGCESLKSIYIPDSVIIDDGCLCERCTNLEYARLSKNMRYPGIAMFNGCTSLRNVVLNEGLEYIGENMFCNCTSLAHLHIPSTVRYIQSDTFCNTSLKEITLPDGLESIGYDTFVGCRRLQHLTIPAGVVEIGPWLVQAHKNFEGIVSFSPYFDVVNKCLIDNKDNALLACWSKEKEFHLPASIKVIKSICNDVIETLVIDSDIDSIFADAFIECANLKRIVCNANIRSVQPSYNCEHIEIVHQL